MLNRVFYGDDLLAHARSANLKSVYHKWQALSRMKRVTFSDLVETLGGQVADRSLLMLPEGGDYYYAFHGAAMRQTMGVDLAGKMLSEIRSSVAPDLKTAYDQVLETGVPVFLLFAADIERDIHTWERLILPLPVSERTSMLFVYSEMIDAGAEAYGHLFRTSPNIMLVALPVLDHEDRIEDATVVRSNPRANAFFGIERRPGLPVMLRKLGPWFDRDEFWADAVAPLAPGAGSRTVAAPHGSGAHTMWLERLETFVVIAVRPGTGSDILMID